MIWTFLLLFTAQTLSPHPITFSVDGRPTTIVEKVDGKYYEIKWENDKLDLREYFPPKKPPEEILWERFFYGMGCLIPFIASACVMIWLAIKIFEQLN